MDILIVDYERDTLRLAQRILEMENYSVKTTQSSEEALRLIKKCGVIPRLILLDLRTAGFSVLQILKSDEKYVEIKVIMFTMKEFKKDYDLAKQLGADGYITKPFSPTGLVQHIREKLGS